MGLTYTQALDLLRTIDALGSGAVELEVDGVHLAIIKDAATEADPAPSPMDDGE